MGDGGMEVHDDSHYLTEPDEREHWCQEHGCKQPCAACKYEEED